MSNYAYIVEGVVNEVIPSENPDLPGFALEERYSADFIKQLVEIPIGLNVGPNWRYDADTSTFLEPVLPMSIRPTSEVSE